VYSNASSISLPGRILGKQRFNVVLVLYVLWSEGRQPSHKKGCLALGKCEVSVKLISKHQMIV
jgi:hypothetical protein